MMKEDEGDSQKGISRRKFIQKSMLLAGTGWLAVSFGTILGCGDDSCGSCTSCTSCTSSCTSCTSSCTSGTAGCYVSAKFTNDTGTTIYYLYISPANDNTWGGDQLGSNVLPDNSSVTVSNIPCGTYDFKAVDSNGNAYYLYNKSMTSDGHLYYFTIR